MNTYQEGKDSTFTHLGKTYLVDDIIALTRGSRPISIKISDLDWVFEYSQPDPTRIKQADPNIPIIVTKAFVDGKMRWVVLDGLHRLTSAMLKHWSEIKCLVVTESELNRLKQV